ncbi:orotate phosphoribosyltransferase [Erysipelothrix sp. HDW6C]|uniref:orotate phosphoribosyltransferase n=1 Tax=Erysipelothrix sp. HDW6C TaxID=2714930 RepID=UPI001407C997|nr:orotate phosphoribosyltransferase [Erysipelothrix sp. HDW6C]QIK69127.1 orotate phosphoribosyltransferase [Erysipelothrix sp. HDW6C]
MTLAKNIAKHLLEVKAVTLSPNEPYTWASGLKSPIYCDNRITMSFPETRNTIAQGFAQQIKAIYPDVEYIVGTATAGIPQACWVAEILGLPMAYVRPKPKDHGKSKQIEGFIPEGAKVVVIEDLISTGGSCIKACEALRVEGIEILGVMAVFTYELESAKTNFEHADIELVTLSNYTTLIEIAKEQGYIDQGDVLLLQSWKASPHSYGI